MNLAIQFFTTSSEYRLPNNMSFAPVKDAFLPLYWARFWLNFFGWSFNWFVAEAF